MEDTDEAGRRIVSVVQMAMLAAIPLYAGILWLARGVAAPVKPGPDRLRLVGALLVIGTAEWAAATWLGRRFLLANRLGRGRSGPPSDRVRRYFLVRFAAAEALAVFGLFAGLTGVRFAEAGLLFAASALALVVSTPTRGVWEKALLAAVGENGP